MEEILRSMKLGHVPKSGVVREDLAVAEVAVAEANADKVVVAMQADAAIKHINGQIEESANFELYFK